MICAQGVAVRAEVADRLGIATERLLALAAERRRRNEKPTQDLAMVHPATFVSETIAADEDGRLLINLWHDPIMGPALRTLVRAMSISSTSQMTA